MNVVSSKNTWYFIFSVLFVIIVTVLAFRFLFNRVDEKLGITANKQSTLTTTQTQGGTDRLTKLPTPLPTPTSAPKTDTAKKPLISLFDTTSNVATGSSHQVTTAYIKIDPASGSAQPSGTKSKGDLEIITKEDGTTCIGTKNSDGSDDSLSTTAIEKQSTWPYFMTLVSPPAGFATDIVTLINQLMKWVIVLVALLALSQLIWGGLDWITSGGDKGKIESARQKIVNAVIGLIVVASSYAILMVALNFLGFASLNELIEQGIGPAQVNSLKNANGLTASDSGSLTKTATGSGMTNTSKGGN